MTTQPPPTQILPARSPGRAVVTVLVVAALAVALVAAAGNPRFEWDVVFHYFLSSQILEGLGTTLLLTLISMVAGILIGVLLAIMSLSGVPIVRALSAGYIWLFRGVPLLVQLIFWFNMSALFPAIGLGLPGTPLWLELNANELVTPFVAAVLALSLNEGAYMAEIVRAGLLSVGKGQSEAAYSIGMSKTRTMLRVVLPQSMRIIIPPTGNQTIGMLKTTSLVSVIAVTDLLYSTQLISSTTFKTIPLLITASLWYLLVTSVLSIGQHYLEREFSKGSTRDGRPTAGSRVATITRTLSVVVQPTKKRRA